MKAGTCLGTLQPVEVIDSGADSGSILASGVSDLRSEVKSCTGFGSGTDRGSGQVSDFRSNDESVCENGDYGYDTEPYADGIDLSSKTAQSMIPEDEHIETLLQSLPSDLSEGQMAYACQLLREHADVFSKNDFDLGSTSIVQHRIDTGNARPFRQPLRRHPVMHLDTIDQHVDRMLQQGIIEPAASPWASNVVLVRKKDNSLRFCIDYRRLNEITYKDTYPLPRIESCLGALDGASWFSTLDLRSGYWQVRQDPRDADKTAFLTRRGCFRFKVLSFGLTNAPSLFQRLMDLVLSGLTWDTCLVYIDDIILFARDFDEHVRRLGLVLQRLREANLS
jgi:hypothetical protein